VRRSLTHLDALDVSAEDFLAAVLETAVQPIWVVDPDGLIRFANPAAIAALGYDSADELLGRRGHDTIHHRRPDGTPRPVTDCALMLPRTTGETVRVELDWFVRRDGSVFPVSYVSAPLEMPEGRSAVVAFTDIEERMRAERELRERDAVLAAQQASLRRVATQVAGGVASADVFAAIAREVGHVIGLPLVALWRYECDGTATVIGAWGKRRHPFRAGTRWPLDGPTICAQVLKTGRPARIDDFADVPGTVADAARETGICACAGAPIMVDGEVWGALSVDSTDGAPLPDHVEDRLTEFTELVAAAISNSASREQLVRLADEQAALRRVATLVARGVRPPDLFAAVAREVGLLVGGDAAHVGRYEEGAANLVASWSPTGDHVPLGTLVPIDGENVASLVLRTGQPARMNSYEHASGPIATMAEALGIRSSVGAPIVVDGRRWGMTIVSSKDDHPFPADTERRVAAFTELVATAISNTEARKEAGRLAEEQAALRRVATLVAEGVPPGELFAAVTAEVGRLLRADLAAMIHYETDGTVTPVATWAAAGEYPEVPDRWPTEHGDPATIVAETRRPARIDNWDDVPGPIAAWIRDLGGITSSVGGPILVAGDLWGALAVHSKQAEPLPANTELRLENFTELVATAISNAQARAEVARLADEQAALRRVATLVARGSPPQEVFAAVAEELGRLLPVEDTAMLRYEDDGTATLVATGGDRTHTLDVGTRLPLDGENATALVHRTGRPARIDDYGKATGAIGERVRDLGTASVVGFPIVVDGGLWGVMVAAQGAGEPLPAGTESRVGKFTELLATAVSNVQARSDLAASRARVVAAADEERRRVVRDLHDGAQQRLIHTIVTLRLAHEALQPGQEPASELVSDALEQAQHATAELRELAQGILPTILTRGGLRAAVEALATRTQVPVEVTVSVDRLPAPVEATAYFVVAEALTNVAKHSRATCATVTARVEDGTLRVEVRDDGVGGARPDGSGIVGLADRLAALDGRLRVESPADGGTLVAADIPIPRA
jgi:PAS domain S-box-containing protein